MAVYVKKTVLGTYKDLQGGHSEPECTHVILTLEEYNELERQLACARRDADEAKTSAQRRIESAEWEARDSAARANREAEKRVSEVAAKLAAARKEAEYQKGLNENLLRISRERANADRKLKPKKEHTGYLVVSSAERDYRYRVNRSKWATVRLWETVIQCPYTIEFPHEQVKTQSQELFAKDSKEGWLIGRIGIDAEWDVPYEELIEHPQYQEWQNLNVMLRRHFKGNYRTGYWELYFQHTKPLGIVPKEMRVCD